jgi:hypothetical protein
MIGRAEYGDRLCKYGIVLPWSTEVEVEVELEFAL